MDNKNRETDGLHIVEEFRKVKEVSEKIDVSASVMHTIRELEKPGKAFKPSPFRWSFAMTLAGLFLIILISFTFFWFQKEYGNGTPGGVKHIKINSVEIDGKAAKQYHFNSENENRVVIWVQKYSEG